MTEQPISEEAPAREQPVLCLPVEPGRRRTVIWSFRIVAVLFLAFIGAGVYFNFRTTTTIFLFPGENTIGEAGKVFYSERFRSGESVFLPGDVPPYYPSFHGPLFHVAGGVLAAGLNLETHQIYYAGRAVSALAALVSLFGIILIARELRAPPPYWLMAALLFFSTRSIHSMTSSFRPDNWTGAIGIVMALLFLRWGRRWPVLAVLVVLPTISFFIKPTGFATAGGVFLALLVMGRVRHAVFYAAAAWGLLLVSIAALQWASGGAYFRGLADGMGVEFTFHGLWTAWGQTAQRTLLFTPLVLGIIWLIRRGRPVIRRPELSPHQERIAVVGAFYLVTFLAYSVAATREGSFRYYFFEPYALACALVAALLAAAMRTGVFRRQITVLAASGVLVLYAYGNIFHLIGYIPPPSVEFYRDMQQERLAIAERINREGLKAFADDPSLNVLLDDPEVIYVLLVRNMIDAGTMDREILEGPLRRQEYEFLAILGTNRMLRVSVFQQMHHPRPILEENYTRLRGGGGFYMYFVPNRLADQYRDEWMPPRRPPPPAADQEP